jgi:hypothetical protein
MLRVTSDIFSGRPNPSWVIEDEGQSREYLRKSLALRGSRATTESSESSPLGFRGLVLEPINDELARDFNLSTDLWIPSTLAAESEGRDLLETLILSMSQSTPTPMTAEVMEATGESSENLQQFLLDLMPSGSRQTLRESGESGESGEIPALEALPTATCYYEVAAYNPSYWNNNPTIRSRNNCYNYASNKRTDTFAQPGKGCGRMYTALTCAEVTRAALCDRLHRRCDCFPDSEKPRYLVALVIWPNRDFHWYRLNKEGFWSHKPGSTAVRNVDNSGKIIKDPATCDRGSYTQFCGYFYTCKSQLIQ